MLGRIQFLSRTAAYQRVWESLVTSENQQASTLKISIQVWSGYSESLYWHRNEPELTRTPRLSRIVHVLHGRAENLHPVKLSQ